MKKQTKTIDELLSKEWVMAQHNAFDLIRTNRDREWIEKLDRILKDCTTEWGTTDFEMFAEKVLEFLAKLKGDSDQAVME